MVEHEKMTHEMKQSIFGLKIDDIKIPQMKKSINYPCMGEFIYCNSTFLEVTSMQFSLHYIVKIT